jgi:hypothetical protein
MISRLNPVAFLHPACLIRANQRAPAWLTSRCLSDPRSRQGTDAMQAGRRGAVRIGRPDAASGARMLRITGDEISLPISAALLNPSVLRTRSVMPARARMVSTAVSRGRVSRGCGTYGSLRPGLIRTCGCPASTGRRAAARCAKDPRSASRASLTKSRSSARR